MKNLSILFLFFIPYLQAQEYASLYFSGNCVSCHKINSSTSAPSVIEFKQRYKNTFSNKKEFIHYMSRWVLHPKKETSIMEEEINEYGLMPELAFELNTLEVIAEYIYETNFTKQIDQ